MSDDDRRPILVGTCAVRLREDESRAVVRYFRQFKRSVKEQSVTLDQPLYLGASGARAQRIDVANWRCDVRLVTPNDVDVVWPQFVAYRQVVERIARDYADVLERVWLFFSDADDLWAPTRYEEMCAMVEQVQSYERCSAIVDTLRVANRQKDDAPHFASADDVTAGISDGRVECVERVRAAQEYTQYCVRFAIVREFFERFEAVLSSAYADIFFNAFVGTYRGADGYVSAKFTAVSWCYFYRQHADSLTAECEGIDHLLGTREELIERMERNVDMIVWLGLSYRNGAKEQEKLIDKIVHSFQECESRAVAACSVAATASRVAWWRGVAPGIGHAQLSRSVDTSAAMMLAKSRALREAFTSIVARGE